MPKKTKTSTKTKVLNRNKNTKINTECYITWSISKFRFHPRGWINNEIQQPTIVQKLQAPPDPIIEKLNKRTQKLKEYFKASKENNNIQTTQPTQQFQDVFSSPSGIRNSNSRLIEEETIEPNSINFNTVEKPKKKSLLTWLFSSNKKKVSETKKR